MSAEEVEIRNTSSTTTSSLPLGDHEECQYRSEKIVGTETFTTDAKEKESSNYNKDYDTDIDYSLLVKKLVR